MAQWAQGLGAPTASTADVEQPVLSRPLTLTTHEKVMEAGQNIDSTPPFKYEVDETHKDQEFRAPRQQLPAWKNRHEFIRKLDGSRLSSSESSYWIWEDYDLSRIGCACSSKAFWSHLLHSG